MAVQVELHHLDLYGFQVIGGIDLCQFPFRDQKGGKVQEEERDCYETLPLLTSFKAGGYVEATNIKNRSPNGES